MNRPLRRAGALLAVVALMVAVAVVSTTRARAAGDLLERVALENDPENVLRGTLVVETNEPAALTVELRSPDHAFRVVPEASGRRHRVPLLGLRAEHAYRVAVTARTRDGDSVAVADAGVFRTGALPGDLPPLELLASHPQRMAPGLTLFNSVYRAPDGEEGIADTGWLQAVDAQGEIVWYLREEADVQDARRLPDGDLLYISDETGARRITPTGEVLAEWRGSSPGTPPEEVGAGLEPGEVVRVDTNSMHHEIGVLPNGNLITLSRTTRRVPLPAPPCEGDREVPAGPQDVVTDVVVEFDPQTGEIVRSVDLFDVLDPADDRRVLEDDVCQGYLDRHFPDTLPRDWTHGNAVVLDEERNTLIVSLRHTDELVGLRWRDDAGGESGELLWQLGPFQDAIELVGDGDWFWHQHAPEVQPDGSILLYDNGNDRIATRPEDVAPYSRAVRYELDLDAGQVRQVWEHRAGDVYAFFLGDADRLDGGTVLVTHGGSSEETDDGGSVIVSRLVEVDEETGEIVWDLRNADPLQREGWGIYRAERIPTIYPAGYRVDPLPAPGVAPGV